MKRKRMAWTALVCLLALGVPVGVAWQRSRQQVARAYCLYMPWASGRAVPGDYPLMYDRRLANHGGKGINVLLVEQTVSAASPGSPGSFRGQFFWDEGARWLQQFVREHPDFPIPVPEDLQRGP
jgi:hypothetical protein